jgi:ATP-dependent exoDNAse (exonuclease V) beta subunit
MKKHFVMLPAINELVEYPKINIDGKRHYQIGHVHYPSITTVLGSTADKSYLKEWRNRVGDEAADRITNNSARRGTNLHQMCEDYLKNNPLSCKLPDALEMFYSVRPILNRIDNIHCQEKSLYSHKIKIAGSVDCIGEFDGVLSVIDFKNSRRIKEEEDIFDYFLQATFYSLAYQEMTGIKIKQVVIIIAVEDEKPQVFIKEIRPYIEPLVERRKLFERNA